MRIGVLALQGGFAEHLTALGKAGAEAFEIRKKGDLEGRPVDGLILPGGESSVIGKLLRETGLFEPIRALIEEGLPVFGTCAGMILLAKHIANDSRTYFEALDITVRRNAYGRQLGSFSAAGEFVGVGTVPMTFIRAPYIEAAGPGVRVLSRIDGHIVAAESGNILVTSFHPELTEDRRVLSYFLGRLNKAAS